VSDLLADALTASEEAVRILAAAIAAAANTPETRAALARAKQLAPRAFTAPLPEGRL